MPDLLTDVDAFPRTSVLSGLVHRVLGLNPSAFTGPGTNTYIVGVKGNTPLLIDTGSGLTEYRQLLNEHLTEHGIKPLNRCLLTHVHPDHIGGAGDLRGMFPELPVHKYPWPEKDTKYDLDLNDVRDGERFEGEGFTIQAIYTPGHARDHICYYLEEEKALFTGDVILGVGTTVIPTDGGDLADYLATLGRLQGMDIERIYPGHGPVVENPAEKIAAYLAHRMKRETQVLHELSSGDRSAPEIVSVIYREYPAHLHNAAAHSILAHLVKLEREGRVQRKMGDPPRFSLSETG